MKAKKYNIYITSDEEYFLDYDFECALDNDAVDVHIATENKDELMWFVVDLIERPLGMWYWVVDDNNVILSGAIDPEDIDRLNDYFEIK